MNRSVLAVATMLACAIVVNAQSARSQATPIPKVSGPIPASASSALFLEESKNFYPIDLTKAGYVEEEFIVTGTANVYDWAPDGTLSVKTPNASYGTRILVR